MSLPDDRPEERCRYPGCYNYTRTGLLCPEHMELAQDFSTELSGHSTYERISLTELSVDPRFQRGLNENRVKRIVNRFDEHALGLLTVSRRSAERVAAGEQASTLLDGQQRWTALMQLSYKWAPCEVMTDLSFEQEVMIFCVRNQERTQVPLALLFNDKAKAGVEPFRTAVIIMRQFNYRLEDQLGRTKVKPDRLSCPAVVEKIHRMGRLSPTLFAIRRAWPGSAEPNRAEVLMGIAAFLQLNQHIPADELAAALSRWEPEILVKQAQAIAKGSIERRLWVHFYEQVVQAFNYGKKINRVSRLDVPSSAPRIWEV